MADELPEEVAEALMFKPMESRQLCRVPLRSAGVDPDDVEADVAEAGAEKQHEHRDPHPLGRVAAE